MKPLSSITPRSIIHNSSRSGLFRPSMSMMPCKGKDVDDPRIKPGGDEHGHDDAERLRPTKHNIISCLGKYIHCSGIKYSLFRAEQGIGYNALKRLNELTPRGPKWAIKRGDFRKFPVIFPALRESDGVAKVTATKLVAANSSSPGLSRRSRSGKLSAQTIGMAGTSPAMTK